MLSECSAGTATIDSDRVGAGDKLLALIQRDAERFGDLVQRRLIDGHLADDVTIARRYNKASHRFLPCY